MTVSSPRTRVAVALTVLVGTALLPALGIVVQLAQAPGWYRSRDDTISAVERHCAALRDALHDATVVGYLAPPLSGNSAAQAGRLLVLRYTLAPVDVVADTDEALVVADGVPGRGRLPPGFVVRRDVGNGLLLLERREGSPP